jgi:single-strand DNA-binding protein
MSQGGYVTLVGFVAREPRLRQLVDGRHVTEVRVGTTTRVLDKLTNEWRDGDTSYYTVNCWRRLADHVNASLRKGDPVMVKGRFKTRSYEDKVGRLRTEVEIVADTVGHDLNRGVANYIRQHRPRTEDADGRTAEQADGRTAEESAETVEAAEDIDIIDEEAIEQFGRELEAGLDEAARALDDDTADEPEIQPAQDAVPPVPQVPF